MRNPLSTVDLAAYVVGASNKETDGHNLVDIPTADFLAILEEVAEHRLKMRREKDPGGASHPNTVIIGCGEQQLFVNCQTPVDASKLFVYLHSCALSSQGKIK